MYNKSYVDTLWGADEGYRHIGRAKERQCVGGVRWTGNIWEELRRDSVWGAGGQGTYGKS